MSQNESSKLRTFRSERNAHLLLGGRGTSVRLAAGASFLRLVRRLEESGCAAGGQVDGDDARLGVAPAHREARLLAPVCFLILRRRRRRLSD